MRLLRFAIGIFLLACASASAYTTPTWTQLQWGISTTSGYPYPVCMNISGSWSCIGSVNSGGVFSASSSSMPAFTGGDCTSTAGSVALNCTKTGGVSFGYFATGTDASNLTGTIAAARMPAFTGGDCTTTAGSVALDCKSTFVPTAVNNTALSALPYSYASSVIRLGYAVVGDAPAVLYTRSNSVCSLNAGAGDGGYQVPTSDGKCWIATLPSPADVRIWGAKCDGSTDDSARLNVVFSSPAKSIGLPPGTCVFSSGLTIDGKSDLSVVGAGRGTSALLYNGAATNIDLVTLSNSYMLRWSGIRIWSSTVMTSGAALRAYKLRYSILGDIDNSKYNASSNTLWNALYIDQPDMVLVNDFNLSGQNDGFAVSANGIGTSYQYDVFANGGKVSGSAAGVHVGGGIDNVYFDNMMITSNTINVLVDHAISSYKNQEITFGSKVVTDQGVNYNYYIDDSFCDTANYGYISIGGPITYAKTHDGVYIKNWPNCQVIIKSPMVAKNVESGIHIADVSAIVSISPETNITNNGTYGILSDFSWDNLLTVGRVYGNTSGQINANVGVTNIGGFLQAPTISSGFGTGASVSQANGTFAFLVNVGTGGVATSGVIGMPRAKNGWNCFARNGSTISTSVYETRMSGNTQTSVTLQSVSTSATATAWGSGDVLAVNCAPR